MTALRCCEVAIGAWLVCVGVQAQASLDSDGDGVLDILERDADTDGDGLPDVMDPDDDGDLLLTRYEYFPSGDAIDTDRDGLPDYLDADDDDDLILTLDEAPDPNGDGNPKDGRSTTVGLKDYLNEDDDSDGVVTAHERPDAMDQDTDGDHTPDQRDNDDDGDGRFTIEELGASAIDSDADKQPDYLDPDDDGDTLATLLECADFSKRDVDGDGLINCLDLDSDGDGIPDQVEGTEDSDGDGTPNYLDPAEDDDTGQGNVLTPVSDAGRDASVADAGRIVRFDAAVEDASNSTPILTTSAGSRDDGCSLGASHGGAWLLLALLRRRRSAR
ncbi:MAG TPA: hypothetical protein VFX59_14810 [Polyangiales bacterium]|nr:hypothetical protein [Polyangiales bacterium]